MDQARYLEDHPIGLGTRGAVRRNLL